MFDLLKRYSHWLHGKWPSNSVEKLPIIDEHGQTNISGVYIAGDLSGIPLLKFAVDSGARIVQEDIWKDANFQAQYTQRSIQKQVNQSKVYDLAIIGCGVAGSSAALEAKKLGLNFIIYEASEPYATLKDFPVNKPIFTYPSTLKPRGSLNVEYSYKESLVDALDHQLTEAEINVTQARIDRIERQGDLLICHHQNTQSNAPSPPDYALRVLIAIGRSGDFRRLDVPGESLNKVTSRLHDPKIYQGQQALVLGGGDTALETAIALAKQQVGVTLAYRGTQFSRPKSYNVETLENFIACDDTSAMKSSINQVPLGSIQVRFSTEVHTISESKVTLSKDDTLYTIPNDVFFSMIGRQAPLDFFRRSGIQIHGEWSLKSLLGLLLFFIFCVCIYHWKSYYWFPLESMNPVHWITALHTKIGDSAYDKTSFIYTLLRSASGPSFYYTILYSSTIGYFGWKRIKRRRTPYVKLQTLSLLLIQWLPLFILPEIILPMMGRNGFFSDGAFLRGFANLFFESYDGGIGEERAYWRAYGFIFAWPLMVYNWFTHQPMIGWLVLGSIQTFVLIPFLVYRWGKGAFCGWICSCGALAETLGDTHRQKMPRGPLWNKLNMIGQFVLLMAFLMMGLRVWGWIYPQSWAAYNFQSLLDAKSPFTYKWIVDIALAGFLGVGFYFHYSGRVWCRFACPLAALMNIYGRFSKFRIFSTKELCISCTICTSVCHQGIDVMSFANRGTPMEDPQCVRCSACVQSCPTGVLTFGRIGSHGEQINDRISASLVQIEEAESRMKR
jgi:NosR/NirI family transcriptional regulator, nitrous oxide reductase regulator